MLAAISILRPSEVTAGESGRGPVPCGLVRESGPVPVKIADDRRRGGRNDESATAVDQDLFALLQLIPDREDPGDGGDSSGPGEDECV